MTPTAPLAFARPRAAVQAPVARWLHDNRIHPQIVGKFDDTALMKAFGKAGAGVFPAPAILEEEMRTQYGAERIGLARDVVVRYYAISVERRLTHPAVVALRNAAQESIFGEAAAANGR